MYIFLYEIDCKHHLSGSRSVSLVEFVNSRTAWRMLRSLGEFSGVMATMLGKVSLLRLQWNGLNWGKLWMNAGPVCIRGGNMTHKEVQYLLRSTYMHHILIWVSHIKERPRGFPRWLWHQRSPRLCLQGIHDLMDLDPILVEKGGMFVRRAVRWHRLSPTIFLRMYTNYGR